MHTNNRTRTLAYWVVCVSLGFMLGCASSTSQTEPTAEVLNSELVAMTFNLRYNNPNDGENAWPKRTDIVLETVREANPDIMGIQEGLIDQVDWLKRTFPEYDSVGMGREGENKGEHMTLFFRRDRFELQESGHFWLSETPEVPGSMGWDAACTRMVTWASLYDRAAEREFVAANTHLDHRGREARLESAKMILEAVAQVPDSTPILLTGDFNSAPKHLVHGILTGRQPLDGQRCRLRDTWYDTPHLEVTTQSGGTPRVAEPGTSHGFRGRERAGRRIDWILVSPQFEAASIDIHDKDYDGRYPSDHFPVYATLRYR